MREAAITPTAYVAARRWLRVQSSAASTRVATPSGIRLKATSMPRSTPRRAVTS